jgi:2,3-bisphosphoglycerate-independent phosphoglycerate mutase
MKNKKIALLILDGWGLGLKPDADAIQHANTPFINSLYNKYPHSKLIASGEAVGLPEGQMGNSEVGHLTIGSGRVIFQELVKIHKSVENGQLAHNTVLKHALDYAKNEQKNVHFFGLLSDGGVHSHINHLKALCDIANNNGNKQVFVHAFLDGRDTDPKSGMSYLNDLISHNQSKNNSAKLASIIGRYYAMDRDLRWERVKLAYDLLVNAKGTKTTDPLAQVKHEYEQGITDEFMNPIVCCDEQNNPLCTIKEGDVVISFNFRTDRAREITVALTQKDLAEFGMHSMNLHYVTMTNYDDSFKHVNVIFDKDNLANTLGEVLANKGLSQIRIAETEKYPHVTFFFSGGREIPFEKESRIMVPSPKVATYDLQPEMSANGITDAIVKEINKAEVDFICLNFANPDMVGHTGVFSAVVKAVETVDACAQKVVEAGLQHGYSFIIIADHGNADYMKNEDGTPNTAHSTNLVPCILIDDSNYKLKDGGLADIAPTILDLFDIPKAAEMNGNSLLVK